MMMQSINKTVNNSCYRQFKSIKSIARLSAAQHPLNTQFLAIFNTIELLSLRDMNTNAMLIQKQQDNVPKKGRPLGYDPDEALETAMHLFWAGGYDATPLDDILNAANISKSSFYHMFGNKQQLFERCLDRYCDKQIVLIEEGLRQSLTGRDFIEAFLYGLVDTVRHKNKRYKGCFMTNTVYEFADRDINISRLISKAIDRFSLLLQAAIEKGQEQGVITNSKSSGTLACFLMSSIAGIRTMIYAEVEIDQLEEIVETTLAALD